jgi:predicted AlkP superfamily pyrophosphatase or phosphodiesterase
LRYALADMNPHRIARKNFLRSFALAFLLATAGIYGQATNAQDQVAPPLLVMISIDGLRPDYITAADAHGAKVPNLRRFLKEGTYADGVEGVVPTVTYRSHTTLVTGVWPAKHGVFVNTTFDPLQKNYQGWYWYTEDIRVPTLWDAAEKAGLKSAAVPWPVTVGANITFDIPEFWRASAEVSGNGSRPGSLRAVDSGKEAPRPVVAPSACARPHRT